MHIKIRRGNVPITAKHYVIAFGVFFLQYFFGEVALCFFYRSTLVVGFEVGINNYQFLTVGSFKTLLLNAALQVKYFARKISYTGQGYPF